MFRIPINRRSACAGPDHTGSLLVSPEESPQPVGSSHHSHLSYISCQARYHHHHPTTSSLVSSPSSLPKSCHPRLHTTSKIKPSSFHPFVLADERVTAWRSPYADVVDNKLSTLVPAHVLERWHQVMANSVTEDARKNYGAGLLRFTQFCDAYSVPESLRVPASEPLLTLFVSEMGAGKVQSSTVDSWLSGLAFWHNVQGARWYGSRILSRTKQGLAAMAPPSTRAPRLPVTEKHIASLQCHLDLNDPFDAAVWAVATIAWHGCTRLGELLPSWSKQFHTSRNVYRSCSRKSGTASNGHEWMNFFIPYTKTKRFRGDWISLTSTNDDSDPIRALRNHLKINDNSPAEAPLFSYSEGPSCWAMLTKEAFLERCSRIWSLDNIDAASGHSFRIGGTTYLLLLGADPWVVMKQGRWSSKAFLLYWRRVEEILPLFIGDAMDKFSSIKPAVSRLGSL
ncbi:DNA breaking-rejoining enzyme [Armillaria luteobubalina]|uniref:DNA breaking-rejoining enzyme n=1 Tax=Armillaria luteobubalina TaxID=153913 RepID=A0AA39PKA2_9AGAR|nr:DNA breaking-rejoining enzyme [Armillaria luteobubalina]